MSPESPSPKPSTLRGRLLAIARVALGAGILAFVAFSLDWKDQLLWRTATGEVHALGGAIDGSFRENSIRFVLAEDAEPGPLWPEEIRTAVATRAPVEVSRAGRGQAGYDWKIGMPRTFSELDPSGLARAMGLFSIGMIIVVTRWWRLLKVASCPTGWWNAFRLTFLGMFFNLAVPGLTGGDLVKGLLAAKENPGRRPDALVSVVVDRVLGLGVLAAMAAVVIVASGDTFSELRGPLLLLLGIGAVVFVLYATPFLRRTLGISALVDRLPFEDKIRSLDRAALLYMRHPWEMLLAVALSVANHLLIIFGIYYLGTAFGVLGVDLRDFLVLVPVANIVSALPLAPGGWGVGEAAFKVLFEMVGANGAMGVAISVTFRLCQLVFGLIGGVFMLLPSSKAAVREAAIEPETP